MPRPASIRRLAVLALIAGCLGLAAAPADAGDYDFEDFLVRTSSWEGHGVGSMIHRRTTQEMQMPQMPGGGQKMVMEVKETLTAITDTEYVIKVETKAMMGWQTTERREPKVTRVSAKAAKIEDAGEEKITIGGETFTCAKKTIGDMAAFLPSMESPGAQGQAPQVVGTGSVWVHPEHGVMKVQSTMSMMGRQFTTNMLATRRGVTETVLGKDYTCREWTMDLGGMGGSRVWLDCKAIPGNSVRATMSLKQQGFSMKSSEEIVAYVKKQPGAVTTGGKEAPKPGKKAPEKAPEKAPAGK